MEIGECPVSCVMLRHYVGATLHYYVGVCGPVNTRTLYICLGLSNLDFPTPRRDGEIAKPCDARTGKRGGAAKRTILLCMCIDHGKEGLTASSLNAFAVKSRRQEDSISYNSLLFCSVKTDVPKPKHDAPHQQAMTHPSWSKDGQPVDMVVVSCFFWCLSVRERTARRCTV